MRAGLWAFALTFAYAGTALAQHGASRVQTADYAYDVPPGWQPQQAAGVEYMHGSVAYPGRTINITTERFAGSASEYLLASMNGLRQQPQVVLQGSRPTRVGSREAYEIESDWRSEGITVHLLQVATVYNGRGFVLTCGDLRERFAQAEAECRNIFRTFLVGPEASAPAGLRVEGPGYSYVLPAGWREEPSNQTVRSHLSNSSPGRSVNLTEEPWNGGVSGYRDASVQGLRSESHIRVIQVRDAMVGSLQGFEVDSLWIEGDVTLHLLQLGTAYNGRGYVLTCGDLEQNFQAAVAECRRILGTFVIGGQGQGQVRASGLQGSGVSNTPASGDVTARVRSAVNARSAELSECQAAALRRGPVAGQVELELVVRRDGSVAGVRVVGDTTGSFGLAPCVQGVVSSVRISEPPQSDTTVRHTVAFGR